MIMDRIGQKKARNKDLVSSVWQFDGRSDTIPYRWYGTLPKQLIERVFDLYTDTQTIVFDPFLGTGNAAVVASERGLNFVGMDVNPLACLLTRLRLLEKPSDAEISEALEALEGLMDNKGPETSTFHTKEEFTYSKKWWREDSLNRTLSLFSAIADIQSPTLQCMFFVAACQEIRSVANIDARCTHHLVTKKKNYVDIFENFRSRIPTVINSMRTSVEHLPKTKHRPRMSISQGDSTQIADDSSKFDFVFAHPPYLGMINYHLIHRLQTDMLSHVQQEKQPASLQGLNFLNSEIKADDVSTDSEQKYGQFIERFAEKMSKTVKQGGKCVVIIGDQRNEGIIRHPFTKFIQEFENNGFQTKEIFVWILQNNAGMHISRRGHFIDHNYILVFQNPSTT